MWNGHGMAIAFMNSQHQVSQNSSMARKEVTAHYPWRRSYWQLVVTGDGRVILFGTPITQIFLILLWMVMYVGITNWTLWVTKRGALKARWNG